jgi:hypothetical protein
MKDIYHKLIRGYFDHGFAPIPVKFRSKEPIHKGWNKLRVSVPEIEEYFAETPVNIGILTGKGNVPADVELGREALPTLSR